MSKFKVGDRVRLKMGAESYGRHCAPGFITTVVRSQDGDGWCRVKDPDEPEGDSGWGYPTDDLELLITEGGAQMARKTYKLIKDTPTVKKGAIYQEACDDGTQEYIILDQGFIKDVDGKGQAPIYTRSLVEDAPDFFVEIFQVEPQYMTAPELERWEAFKATKPGKAPVANKVVALKATSYWTPARRKAHSAKLKAAWAAKKSK